MLTLALRKIEKPAKTFNLKLNINGSDLHGGKIFLGGVKTLLQYNKIP